MFLRILFIALLTTHGLIHLIGFIKEFQLATVSQLSGKTFFPITDSLAKPIGLLWLAVCLCLLATAILFFLQNDGWWIPGIISLLLSQALIIIYWQDAKFGTVANAILLLVLIPANGQWRLNQKVASERQAMLQDIAGLPNEILTETRIAPLPEVIRRWLLRSKVVGKPMVKTIYLKQRGQMKTAPTGSWMPFEAEQTNTIPQPAFIWQTTMNPFPVVNITGRDRYYQGRGNMLIEVLSVLPIVNSDGKTIDQGSMLRFLGEMVWFPAGAISPYLSWKEIDARTARATMTFGNVQADGIFRFDEHGDVVSFEANRYYDRKEGATLEKWFIRTKDYREFEGIRIPAQGEVTWKLKDGDYTWLTFELLTVRYNSY